MRWPFILLTLVLIFASNAIFVHPREMPSDTAWLLQELRREEAHRDVRRLGPLQVTPTRVALGESVRVTVEEPVNEARRALVMINSEGMHLETRLETAKESLQTQVFTIPFTGEAGDYRFWLAGSSLEASSGLGVITVEVYDPIPGNLRRASPVEVIQTFLEAAHNGDDELLRACFSEDFFAANDKLAEILPLPEVIWQNGTFLYGTPTAEQPSTSALVRIDIQVIYPEEMTVKEFWGENNTSRFVTLRYDERGWRIVAWDSRQPPESAVRQP